MAARGRSGLTLAPSLDQVFLPVVFPRGSVGEGLEGVDLVPLRAPQARVQRRDGRNRLMASKKTKSIKIAAKTASISSPTKTRKGNSTSRGHIQLYTAHPI